MDEGAVIHEIFSDALQVRFDTSGYLTFAWIIAFVPVVIVIALLYLRFLWHLPPSVRNLMIVAGLLYVGGRSLSRPSVLIGMISEAGNFSLPGHCHR